MERLGRKRVGSDRRFAPKSIRSIGDTIDCERQLSGTWNIDPNGRDGREAEWALMAENGTAASGI
jgi:hypothetical protein